MKAEESKKEERVMERGSLEGRKSESCKRWLDVFDRERVITFLSTLLGKFHTSLGSLKDSILRYKDSAHLGSNDENGHFSQRSILAHKPVQDS